MSLFVIMKVLCTSDAFSFPISSQELESRLWSDPYEGTMYSLELDPPPDAADWIEPLLMCQTLEQNETDCNASSLLCAMASFYDNSTECTVTTNCTDCSTECPPGYEFNPVCSESETLCRPCPPVANCIYANTGQCTTDQSTPNCDCVAGFEMVESKCIPCSEGFYKETDGPLPCSEWNATDCSDGFYAVNGTRFSDTTCLPCPTAPDNATLILNGTGCEWTCDSGFNNMLYSDSLE